MILKRIFFPWFLILMQKYFTHFLLMVTPFSVEWCPEISNKIILPILIIFSQGSEMILTNVFVLNFEYDTSGSDSLTMFDTCMKIYS